MGINYEDMAFPKKSWLGKKPKLKKGPKHRKGESILQKRNKDCCFLCMMLDGDYRKKETEEHHVINGNGRRQISDTYGLTVRLCVEHHRTGVLAVHNNQAIADLLKRYAQQRFQEEYPDLDWMKVVGRNYL